MSGRSFRSVFMVASCAGAALGCYLVSLRVASERAALEDVEHKIVLAERDIRVLQTEIGTRGRLAQLEKWNVRVLALSAPSADQFLDGGFALARLARPQEQIEIEAPVVLAAAPAPDRAPIDQRAEAGDGDGPTPAKLLHTASLKAPDRAPAPSPAIAQPAAKAPPKVVAAAAKPAEKKVVDNKRLADAGPVTKPARVAKSDPLAPLAESSSSSTAKDSGSAR